MQNFSTGTLTLALLGGVVPAVIWLCFWLTEDSNHPEPRKRLLKTFLAGALMALIAVILEYALAKIVGVNILSKQIFFAQIAVIISWSAIEEVLKFIAATRSGLSTPDDDEPIDPVIYMITAALGFAAMENTLYLISPLLHQGAAGIIVGANMRFIGAMLLHTIASGTLGFFMSYSFYQGREKRIGFMVAGLVIATALHAIFNIAIISPERNLIPAFGVVWIAVIGMIYIFEKVKTIHKN